MSATVAGVQTPRICSFPDYVSSAGEEAIALAALAGLILDPWQEFVLVNALGERLDGRWAAPTVGLVVGRQNGKNAVLEARELAGLFLLDERVIIHSAHEQATSSEHFRRLLQRIESVPEFDRRVFKAVHGKGSEAIELLGGQRILFKTRTGGAGLGFTADCIVFDEAMILNADAKAALIPTMAARSIEGNTQTWYAGSAVDQTRSKHDGLELARIRARGIKQERNIAYFEWSIGNPDPDDDRPWTPDRFTAEMASDMSLIAQANPGLGIRISEEWVEHERTVELGEREFAVERGGVGDWPDPDGIGDSPISVDDWNALADEHSVLIDPIGLCFDITPDRSSAAISAAGARIDGKGHVEVVEHRRGTGWVVERIAELMGEHDVAQLVCDGIGPAASLVSELEALGFEVTLVSARDHANACGLIYDAVEQKTLRHLGTGELSAAIRGASKRPLGDAWAWSRKGGVDISPLVAVTLALASVWSGVKPDPEPMVAYR